ncbi:MAG: glutamine-hydrolyzing carbamoyl-phosphate synthase small subunit [Methanobacteriaceae archaeon]|nr:glutamine-hydrolyzing carbamoyl-phosphate synthase small subunit [Methanobacteriaceae archaeon]
MNNEAKLALEDGTILKGKSFGYESTAVGELVFTTAMSGYVEALTDPSFKGHILMSNYPLEGNYGVSEDWYQSDKIQAEAYVAREVCNKTSNFGFEKTLDEFLKEFEVPGIMDIDTRALTLMLREKGAMKCAVSTEEISDEELIAKATNSKGLEDLDLVPLVSTDGVKTFGDFDKTVAILDLGVKKSVIDSFIDNEIAVALFPYNTNYQEIIDYGVDGFMLSSGPGNPNKLDDILANVEGLLNKFPVFAQDLGQELIAKSFGASVNKMKLGHRGANQPVKDLVTGNVLITAQNHGFAIDKDSLASSDLELTQINLNDGTPEGFKHKELPLRTIQFESTNADGFFEEFAKLIKDY